MLITGTVSRPGIGIMKYVNIVLCVLMVLFAGVQYNDPDAIFWIVVYLIPAAWAGLAAFRLDVLRTTLPLTLLGVCLIAEVIGSIYLWPTTPEFWRQDVWWETETAREGMGIMIATSVVAVAFVTGLYARSRSASET